MNLTATLTIDRVRLEANCLLNPARKSELGQFMTSSSVAHFMASLFSNMHRTVRLLDAGAGVGSLTAAFLERWNRAAIHVTAYEIEESLASYLRKTLARYGYSDTENSIITRDFIQDAVYRIKLGTNDQPFSHAILNPPYKKIKSSSLHRALLRAVNLETVNLYTAFVGLTLELMRQGGEIVAIVPRSFCNGVYYKPFRGIYWKLRLAPDSGIGVASRVLRRDHVLQEDILTRGVKGAMKKVT